MPEETEVFGYHPFPSNKKKPIHIRGDLIKHFIYPAERPHFSDLNYLFVSTDKLTMGTWQLGPGGTYDPPDLHAGDEVYYVLDGVLTEHNPLLGEFIQVKKGEALFIPMHGYHKGYNFEQGITRTFQVPSRCLNGTCIARPMISAYGQCPDRNAERILYFFTISLRRKNS